jgi:hypothetical protein
MRHGALPHKHIDVSVERTTLLASYLLGLLLDPEDEDCTRTFSQYAWLQQRGQEIKRASEQKTLKYEDAAVYIIWRPQYQTGSYINKVQSYELD